jgi:hypothetical protein
LQVEDSRFQLEEAEVRLTGANEVENSGIGAGFVADNPSGGPGDVVGVNSEDPVYFRNLDSEELFLALSSRVPGGFTRSQFANVFGFEPHHKSFLAMLFTMVSGAMQVIRVVSALGHQVKMGARVVKNIRGVNSEQFLKAVDFENALSWQLVRDGIPLGGSLEYTQGSSTIAFPKTMKEGDALLAFKNATRVSKS